MQNKRIAILGASEKQDRYSNKLLRALKTKGYQVLPIHPSLEWLEGEKVYSKLSDLPQGIDILSVYINASRSAELAKEILALGAKKVIFNPGSENPELMKTLQESGIEVEAACSLVLNSLDAL